MLFFTLDGVHGNRWPVAPIRLLARRDGVYKVPILAYGIDFRFEDNKGCDLCRSAGLKSTWIAKHPLDDYYLLMLNGDIVTTHATSQFINVLRRCGQLPQDLYCLPDDGESAWWEWVIGYNCTGDVIKAPKRPRQYDPTPELIDERYESVICFSDDDFDRILKSVQQESNKCVYDVVRTRAYYLWLEAGGPQRNDQRFWYQATLEFV